MKIVVAIDSFKGSLTSLEAGESVKAGILKAMPDADITVSPLADGGEGTVEALVLGMHGRIEKITVTGPLGKPVACNYGIIASTHTAIIEIAEAAGITLVADRERNPMNTTTYGVGEIIKDAIEKGCRRFIVGIGGSATNDCGVGMLMALGYSFLDKNSNPVEPGAKGLKDIATIDSSGVIPELLECSFHIACDVTNPLCGANGCSAVYGPQKGATPAMILEMDSWLAQFATLAGSHFPNADPDYPGSGAAGGLGFAFRTFTNACLESGVSIVLKETNLEEKVRNSDLVITGEGRLDSQTVMGKAPIGVARLAKKYSKPVIAFSGCVTEDATVCNQHGIDAFFPVVRRACTVAEAVDTANAKANIMATVEQVFRLINFFHN